jgi:Carboxypeptidase regulatory-like domain
MKAGRFLSNWGAIVVLLLFGGTPGARAQLAVTTATLTGTVTDPTGSVVPDAKVTLSSPERGITRTFTTGAQGNYSFSQLAPSTYQLTIQAKGFNQYIQNGITLDAGQSASQDIRLNVGSVDQQVVVSSQANLLNTENSNISAEVDSKQIVELPLNLRNIYNLATLNSSVNNNAEYQVLLGGGGNTTDSADQDVSFMNFSGGFFGTSGFLLDGTFDVSPDWGEVMYVPSVDAVEEFKIQNSSFTAQYGWSTGNIVDVTTKSGTNTFHGDTYFFYRNAALDANLWFSNHHGLPKQDVTREQFGVTAGGPLYIPHLYEQRDKTFIFGVYERFSAASPSTGIFTVPDAQFRAGNFAQLLGPQVGTDALGRPVYSGQIYDPRSGRAITAGVVDPTTGLVANSTGYIRDPISNNNVAALGPFDAVGAKLLSYYPTPTNSALANNLTVNGNAPASSDEYSVRLDHNINDASRYFARASIKEEYKTGEPAYYGATNDAGPGVIVSDNRWDFVAGYSHVFNQTLTMNALAGTQYHREHDVGQSQGFAPSSLGLPSYLDANPNFPQVTVTGQSNLGNSTGGANAVRGPVTTAAVNLEKILGKHTLSFGFMGVDMLYANEGVYENTLDEYGHFTCGPNPYLCTANTGNAVAQMLLGLPDGGGAGIASRPAASMHFYAWYLQDDWHVIPKLTLNLGLRYEIQGAPTYRRNEGAYFDANIDNPIGPAVGVLGTLPGALQYMSSGNRGIYKTNYDNLSPRIGFSYQALPKLIFRGGYGIFFPISISQEEATTDGYSPNTAVVSSLNAGVNAAPGLSLENPWPNGFVQPTGNSLGALQDVGYSTTAVFRQRPSSYVQQYMLGLQYGFTPNDSLELNYYGSHGTHMLSGNGISHTQVDPSNLPLGTQVLNNLVPNPFYGHIAAGKTACGMDQPTIVYSHLLQPYPQYCGVTENQPNNGFSLYDAFEATYNHRFHNGLSVLVSYTFSKFLDNVEGVNSWAMTGNSSPANNYNLAAEKSVDGGDTPQSLVVSYIYDLPVGRGKKFGSGFNRKVDGVLGGWEVTGIVTSKSGIPIAVSGNNIPSYGGTPRPDVIANTHAAHQSVAEWFNTGAFAYAPYGTFGTASRYLSYMRAPDYNNFDTGIMKNWSLFRETRLQFRAEMFNTFNHPQFYSPSGAYPGCDPNVTSTCPSGFGQITNAFPGREVQVSGKFYW